MSSLIDPPVEKDAIRRAADRLARSRDICACFSENQVRPSEGRVRTYVLAFFDHAGRIDACVFLARPRTLRGIILAVNRAVFHGRSRACSRSVGARVFPPESRDRSRSLSRISKACGSQKAALTHNAISYLYNAIRY